MWGALGRCSGARGLSLILYAPSWVCHLPSVAEPQACPTTETHLRCTNPVFAPFLRLFLSRIFFFVFWHFFGDLLMEDTRYVFWSWPGAPLLWSYSYWHNSGGLCDQFLPKSRIVPRRASQNAFRCLSTRNFPLRGLERNTETKAQFDFSACRSFIILCSACKLSEPPDLIYVCHGSHLLPEIYHPGPPWHFNFVGTHRPVTGIGGSVNQ